MSFGRPDYLWLLLAIPPGMMAFFWWSGRVRRELMAQFIQARLLPGLIAGVSVTREKIRAAGLVLAVAGVILALAQPQWGYDLEEITQRGLDIVVAVDTSKSMLAEDIAPNRLARAKLAVLDLMQHAGSDRLGLVAFAGSAFLQCPLTVDDTAFRQSVDALNVNTIPEGGTAIGDAIETARRAFKEGDNYKVLVIFTDGEDHDSGAVEAAKRAKEAGLIIFTIGIGSADGELVRVKGANGQSDYIRDESGNVVKSRLNQPLLRDIAGPSPSGFYLPLQGANTIDVLYQKGLAPLPKSESKDMWVKHVRERYHWPLALAVVLLIGEMFFPERKRQLRREGSAAPSTGPAPAAGVVAMIGLLWVLAPVVAGGSPASALREYKAGQYDQALQDYERSIQKKKDDPRLHFNAGASAYRGGQFDQAARHFDEALTSPDLNLQEQSYYNLGNTFYHLGERNPDPSKRTENWQLSLTNYLNSLQLNPQDADSKFNYEFVRKKLEELKKQQQQQKQDKSQQNQDQKQDQNQQQQDQQDQSAKNDQQQQQNSRSQQQNQQQNSKQPQQQAQNQKQPEPARPQPDKPGEKKDQNQEKPQPAQKSSPAEKKQGEAKDQEQAKARAAGQMSPQEARQLLDSQKDDELTLPVSRKEKPSDQERPVKDW